MPEFPNIVLYAIPFFIVTILLEAYFTTKKKMQVYVKKDTFTSLSMGIGNVLLGFVNKVYILLIFYYVYSNYRIFTMPITWYSYILLLFLEDFTYYWYHRISHTSRFFWASHVIHHSSQKYNLGTALRQTWTGGFFGFIFWLWLPLLGFHPALLFLQMGVSLIYQYWIHTEMITKMPRWFEYIMNTPSHHRVHHASNVRYLDKNHAGIFIIWDRMFGTFQPELKEEKPIYGLTTNIKTYNPIKVAFHEWIAMFKDMAKAKTNFFNRILYLVKPPGWKHDGTGITTKQLQKQMK